MSAPLVVNTKDGTVWTRREGSRGGEALYAPEKCGTCPQFVMATLTELAEQGIAGSANVLPVPTAPAPRLLAADRSAIAELIGDAKPAAPSLLVSFGESVRDRREHDHSTQCEDWFCLNLAAYMGERMGPVLRRLLDAEARVGELLAERHSTNESLSKAAEALRANRDRIAELEAAPTTVYRAEHPDSGITLGHYGAESAARAHCEATERRSWPTGTSLSFDWLRDALPEDDENGIAELVVTAGQNEESSTGYIVTALELASEYDEEADE
ncbi:hypothetical protein ACIP6Q_39255 [Streptomyces bobili]|uniref:hypothetical protein n=1 Tax=Streptomyces bobili TaxID=67280 RepID=UPI0038023AA4